MFLVVCLVVALAVRLWQVWPRLSSSFLPTARKSGSFGPVLFVLGSGGHTAELLPVASSLGDSASPKVFVAAEERSLERAKALEKNASFVQIPRARAVGQSYLTSVATTLWALLFSVATVLRFRPRLVLCNGPGICVPIAAAAMLLRLVGGRSACRVVFIESGCRVESLSLSGKILYRLCLVDAFLVQWESLQQRVPKSIYLGRTL